MHGGGLYMRVFLAKRECGHCWIRERIAVDIAIIVRYR